MTHLLTDIETLGTRPGHVVLSAAFVRFTDEASCTLNLSVPDQEALGLVIDPETHAWWGMQPPEAWQAATANPTPLRQALEYFATWISWATNGAAPGDWNIWCRGFMDTPMLREVYRRAGVPCPWQHWQEESSRSMQKLAGVAERDYTVLPKHVALNDALGDVRASNAALAVLSRAHRKPVFRYFHHPESGSVLFTDDGSHPADRGGVDASHCEEISGPQYEQLERHYTEPAPCNCRHPGSLGGDCDGSCQAPRPPAQGVQRCAVCHSPQFDTPHGVTCANGHGGADSLWV